MQEKHQSRKLPGILQQCRRSYRFLLIEQQTVNTAVAQVLKSSHSFTVVGETGAIKAETLRVSQSAQINKVFVPMTLKIHGLVESVKNQASVVYKEK